MLDNTLTITLGGASVVLTRVDQSNFVSTYFGQDGDDKVSLSVRHQIPSRGGSNESHLVRLDVEHYDALGVYIRQSSAWTVIKTFDGVQDQSDSEEAVAALTGLTDSTFTSKLINRES